MRLTILILLVCMIYGCLCKILKDEQLCERIGSSLSITCGYRLQWTKNGVPINRDGIVDERYYGYTSNGIEDSLTIKSLNMSDYDASYNGRFNDEQCIFKIDLYEEENMFKSTFSADNTQIDDSVKVDSPTTISVKNPLNFTFVYKTQIEALPIDWLKINDENLTATNVECVSTIPSLKCLESKAVLNVITNQMPNETLSVSLGYGFDAESCLKKNVLSKTFGHTINVLFPPKYKLTSLATSVKINKSIEFECAVDYANPFNFNYLLTIEVLNDNSNETQMQYFSNITSDRKKIISYQAENEFSELHVKCKVLNGIFDELATEEFLKITFDNISETLVETTPYTYTDSSTTVYETTTTETKSNGENAGSSSDGWSIQKVIGISLGSIAGFLILLIVALIIIKFCVKNQKPPKDGFDENRRKGSSKKRQLQRPVAMPRRDPSSDIVYIPKYLTMQQQSNNNDGDINVNDNILYDQFSSTDTQMSNFQPTTANNHSNQFENLYSKPLKVRSHVNPAFFSSTGDNTEYYKRPEQVC